MARKNPKTGPRPQVDKRPPAGKRPTDHPDEFPVWRFQYLDAGFPELTGWRNIDGPTLDEIVEVICHVERNPLGQVFIGRGDSKGTAVRYGPEVLDSDLSREAKQRLDERELELDHLVRIRVSWAKRLYAFQGDGNVLNLLWWDPDHEVYPGER